MSPLALIHDGRPRPDAVCHAPSMWAFFLLASFTVIVAGLHLIRGNIYFAIVYQNVTVVHQLSPGDVRWKSRPGKLRYPAPLQQEQKVLAGDALHAGSAFEVVSKLPFEDEVDAFYLLLLSQLLAIADQRLAAAQRVTVLSGGCVPRFSIGQAGL